MKRVATTHLLPALALAGWLASPSLAQGHLVIEGDIVSSLPEATDLLQVARGQASIGLLADGSVLTDPFANGHTALATGAPSGNGYVQISSQGNHALALHGDGSIYAWGDDPFGVVSSTPTGTGFAQVAAGDSHNVALRQDGSLVSWGRNQFGQVSHTPGGTGFIQVAAGSSHSVALRSDGSLAAWGLNLLGSVADLPAGNDFVQVAVRNGGNWALRSNGSIAWWGSGTEGAVDLPDPGPFTDLLEFRFARRADGSLLSWSFFMEDGELPALAGTEILAVAGIPEGALYVVGGDHGTAFCTGQQSSAGCPCTSTSATGTGCPNSDWSGAKLVGFGAMSLAQDSFGLFISELPPQGTGVVLRAANQAASGQGIPLSNGLLCVVGQSQRSQVVTPVSRGHLILKEFNGQPFGQSSFVAGVPTNYQYWYRDAFNTCNPFGFNFSNAWEVIWTP